MKQTETGLSPLDEWWERKALPPQQPLSQYSEQVHTQPATGSCWDHGNPHWTNNPTTHRRRETDVTCGPQVVAACAVGGVGVPASHGRREMLRRDYQGCAQASPFPRVPSPASRPRQHHAARHFGASAALDGESDGCVFLGGQAPRPGQTSFPLSSNLRADTLPPAWLSTSKVPAAADVKWRASHMGDCATILEDSSAGSLAGAPYTLASF
jgi:hypothetical protein